MPDDAISKVIEKIPRIGQDIIWANVRFKCIDNITQMKFCMNLKNSYFRIFFNV